MTLVQIEKRIEALECELRSLRDEVWRLKGYDVLPGIGVVGRFKDDPTFDEAARLGREYRDQVNRESLEEMDREEKGPKQSATPRKKPKSRKSNARA